MVHIGYAVVVLGIIVGVLANIATVCKFIMSGCAMTKRAADWWTRRKLKRQEQDRANIRNLAARRAMQARLAYLAARQSHEEPPHDPAMG